MAKVRVAVWGTVGKSVLIDTGLDARVAALETAIAQIGAGGVTAHNQLTGLTVGDDHSQYAMNAAAETISAPWNFAALPSIEGTLIDEYIQDTIGLELRDSASIYLEYSDYGGTDGKISAHLNNEYVEDMVGAMLTDSPTIDFTYGDVAGDISAAVKMDFPYVWSAVHTFQNDVTMLTHLHLGAEEVMTVNGGVVHGQLEINSDTHSIQEVHTHSATDNSVIYFARSRGSTASPAIVQNGDYLGVLYGVGYDGTDYALGAGIGFIVDGTPGSNDMPTKIVLATSADGTQSPVVRLTINADGSAVFAGAVTGTSFNTFTGFANPSASVGLAAVNGSAATAMRSDGAPALDQAIAPTWTGHHTFSNTINGPAFAYDGGANAGAFARFDANDFGVPIYFRGVAAVPSNLTQITIGSSVAALDGVNGDLVLAPRTSSAGNRLLVYAGNTTARKQLEIGTGATLFGNTTDNPTFDFLGTGLTSHGGAIKTANPGTASGNWKLGTRLTATVALDTAHYVEVDIGGAIVKLGIVT
jgi:hypothetical protein